MPVADTRWVAVGSSGQADARLAGAEAAEAALAGAQPKLLIVFCSPEYAVAELLAGINETAPGVPLVGCSTAGEIAGDRAADHSVVVTALGGTGFHATTRAATGMSRRHRAAGAEVAAAAHDLDVARARTHQAAGGEGEPPDDDRRLLLLFTDGLAGRQEEVIRGAYSVVGAQVPLVGGCAGDGSRMRRTYQLHNDEVLTDAVVGAALSTSGPLGIGVRHGWRQIGDPMIVTRAGESRVYSLGDEPALDAYLRLLDAPAEARSDPKAFAAFAQTHPLGLNRRGGEEMRFISGADFTERSLLLVAEVPHGGLVWITEGDQDSILDATDSACESALEALDGHKPLGLLTFDCIARRGVLGDAGIQREVRRVADRAGGVPVAGFYTYGEIARTRGINGFHNQTLVVLALS